MSKPEVVIFDWDGTIVDTSEIVYSAYLKLADVFDIPMITEQELKENFFRALEDVFPEMFGDRWLEAKELFYKHIKSVHLEKIKLLPGAEQVLQQLSEQKIPMVIVSNKTGDILRKEVSYLNLDNHFVAVVGAGDAEKNKPNAEHAYHALKSFEIVADNKVWFVGDTMADMLCAKNIGAKAILIGSNTPISKVEELAIDYLHVDDHSELLKVFSY